MISPIARPKADISNMENSYRTLKKNQTCLNLKSQFIEANEN